MSEVKRIIAIGGWHICPHCIEMVARGDEYADIDAANGWFKHFDPLEEIVCYANYQVGFQNETRPYLMSNWEPGMHELTLWRRVNGQLTKPIWRLKVHESQIAKEPYLVYAP